MINSLRGFAILLVIIGHILCYYPSLKIITDIVYSFHVPLLFIISGFVISYTSKFDEEWLTKRLKRVLIPFFAYGILYGSFTYLEWTNYFSDLVLYGGIKTGLWFLNTLAWCYLIVFISNKFKDKTAKILSISVVIVIAILFVYFFSDYAMFGIKTVVYFPIFFVGYLIGVHKKQMVFFDRWSILISISGVFLGMMIFLPNLAQTTSLLNIRTVVPIIVNSVFDAGSILPIMIRAMQVLMGSIFAYTIIRLLFKIRGNLNWIGTNTLSIYGIQSLFISLIVTDNESLIVPYIVVIVSMCCIWSLIVNKFLITKVLFAGAR